MPLMRTEILHELEEGNERVKLFNIPKDGKPREWGVLFEGLVIVINQLLHDVRILRESISIYRQSKRFQKKRLRHSCNILKILVIELMQSHHKRKKNKRKKEDQRKKLKIRY